MAKTATVTKLPSSESDQPKQSKFSFAELIQKKPLPVKKAAGAQLSKAGQAIVDNYDQILAAYKQGYNFKVIAETLAELLGEPVKDSTVRNKFMFIAHDKGDLTPRPRKKSAKTAE